MFLVSYVEFSDLRVFGSELRDEPDFLPIHAVPKF